MKISGLDGQVQSRIVALHFLRVAATARRVRAVPVLLVRLSMSVNGKK